MKFKIALLVLLVTSNLLVTYVCNNWLFALVNVITFPT